MNKKSMLLCSLLLAMPALAGCGGGEKKSSDSSLNGNSSIPSSVPSSTPSSESKSGDGKPSESKSENSKQSDEKQESSKEEGANSSEAISSVKEAFDRDKLVTNILYLGSNAELSMKQNLVAIGKLPENSGSLPSFAAGVTTTVSLSSEVLTKIHGKDASSSLALEVEAIFDLGEILDKGLVTMSDLTDTYHFNISEDDIANDVFRFQRVDRSYESFYKYDADNDQYLNYYVMGSGKVNAEYLLTDDNVPDLIEMEEALLYIAANGTYDESKDTITIDVADYEWPEDLISVDDEWITSIGVKLNGNMPESIVIGMDEEFDDYGYLFGDFAFDLDDVSYEIAYDISFKGLGTTEIAFPEVEDPACENHPIFKAIEYGDGHREYCMNCQKFVTPVEDHEEDDTFGICKKCHHHEVSEKLFSENVIGEIPLHAEFREYSYCVDEQGRYFNLTLGDCIEGEFYEEMDRWALDYEFAFSEDGLCYYYPEAGLLIVESYGEDTSKVFEDACFMVYSSTYSFYDVDEYPGGNPDWFYEDGMLEGFLSEVNPRETILSYHVGISHSGNWNNKSAEIDSCHNMVYNECSVCGEVMTYHPEDKHDFEYELISAEELASIIGEESAMYYIDDDNDTVCLRANCKNCDETQYLTSSNVSYTHPNGTAVFRTIYFNEIYGDWFTYFSYDAIDHVLDENNICQVCGYYVLDVAGYSIGFSTRDPQLPYIYDLNDEFLAPQYEGDGTYQGKECSRMSFLNGQLVEVRVYLFYSDESKEKISSVLFVIADVVTETIVFPEPVEFTDLFAG